MEPILMSKAAGTLKTVADKFSTISDSLVPLKNRDKNLIASFDLCSV